MQSNSTLRSVSLSVSDLKMFEQKSGDVFKNYFDQDGLGQQQSDDSNCSGDFVEPLHVKRK